ncbi:unnamed protein product [Gulo gulo]|uniref:Uncharacterized protein n=1 Tax=Gulo gulo TaxID=48420 RepID=A0A9X9LD13_GULGU|nr:unnamed protein product [Gulo gulo]
MGLLSSCGTFLLYSRFSIRENSKCYLVQGKNEPLMTNPVNLIRPCQPLYLGL